MKKSLYSKRYGKLLAWLKEHRVEQGLSMRALGEKLDMPHSFVGKVEQGERRLDVAEYIEYCEVLGLDPVEGITFLKKS